MEAINAIRALSKRVGIPQGFSQLGVSKADIEGWLDKALVPTRARRAIRAPPAAMKSANSIWRHYDPQSFRDAGKPGRA